MVRGVWVIGDAGLALFGDSSTVGQVAVAAITFVTLTKRGVTFRHA